MKGQMASRNESELRAEIRRMEEAIKKTKSEKLKKDYTKHMNRCKKDLQEYYFYTTGKHIRVR